jgi:hypothetical protein
MPSLRILAASLALLGGVCVVDAAAPRPAMAAEIIIRTAPPMPRHELIPAPPAGRWAWIPGRWRWGGNAYAWVPGRYMPLEQRYAAWVPGHWAPRGGGWAWVGGHWR